MSDIDGKTIYLDCSSGVSGDMFTGAMLDLGVGLQELKDALNSLGLSDFEISAGKTLKNGFTATKFNVAVRKDVHIHRHLSDIEEIIDKSTLKDSVKARAKKIFMTMAQAEGKVHGIPPEEVHFHEVGAADSIADIVSAAFCIDSLGAERIICSPLNVGGGTVKCMHGTLPVPAPATAEILRSTGIPFKITSPDNGELVTPTGAAILAVVCSGFGEMPEMTVEKIGLGAGERELSQPNVLRAFLGNLREDSPGDTVDVIETNVDDTTGEALGRCLEVLMEEGAADAYFTPIYMKKQRPAYMLTVLCDKSFTKRAAEIIFELTGSIGLRVRTSRRIIMQREIKHIKTKYGEIPVKFSSFGGVKKYKAEAENVQKSAKKYGVSPDKIYAEIIKQVEKN